MQEQDFEEGSYKEELEYRTVREDMPRKSLNGLSYSNTESILAYVQGGISQY